MRDFWSRLCFSSIRALRGAEACLIGLWLGALTREELYATVNERYTRAKTTQELNYYGKEWNQGGLFTWEKTALTNYFGGCKRLLLIGAGGGREVLALQQLGYCVDGFEAHPDLVVVANELLRAEGYDTVVHLIPHDECPNTGKTYDGIIIAWAAYMHIPGRRRRITYLQQLRVQTRAQCPILLSFYNRDDPQAPATRVFELAAFVANVIRRGLRREFAEVGDWLHPQYIHYFTQDEITSELAEGGFSTVYYSTTDFAHAVGIAV
jgi:protein-L-isoaspartate O-methyltransferase